MKRISKAVVAGLSAALFVLGGCSSVRLSGGVQSRHAGWSTTQTAPGAGEVAELLAYVQRLRGLPEDRLDAEYQSVETRFAGDPNDMNRLRLVLLLTLPGQPFENDDRALGLLDPYTRGAGQSPEAVRHFAEFLAQELQGRRTWKIKLEAERQRSDALQHKINEIKSIEKSINERSRPVGPELR